MSFRQNAALRYIAPFTCFILFTAVENSASSVSGLFALYALKTAATLVCLWICFKDFSHEITGYFDYRAILLGTGVFLLWLLVLVFFNPVPDELLFNPDHLSPGIIRITGIFFRIAGAVIAVPLIEELLWRSFLMRYLIRENFLEIPVGRYSHLSFWITAAAFTFVHRSWEWPGAFLAAILYGGYLVRTKNLRGCILAHAVTNLCLAVFILLTGRWELW